MGILYVCHYFPPFSVGGTEEYTFVLAREMQRRGHDVHVFHGVIGQPDMHEYEVREHVHEGIPCTYVSVDLKEIDDFSGTWRQAQVDQIFAQFLAGRRFDVAHVQHLTRLSLGIVEILRERGVPVVWSLHDYWMQCARGQRVRLDGTICHAIVEDQCASCMAVDIDFLDGRKREGERPELPGGVGAHARHVLKIEERRREMLRALGMADHLLTASRFVRDEYARYGVARDIEVLRYGVDAELRREYREHRSARLRFGFIGRIEPTKGVETLIEAFTLVEGDAELHVHGHVEPEYLARLRLLAAADSRITVHGSFERSDLCAVYAGFDVQVVPSTWLECSPLVVQTAYLFEKPLIVSDLGGLAEIAEGSASTLRFRPGDTRDLAQRMRELVADRSLVASLRAALPRPLPLGEYVDSIESRYRALASSRVDVSIVLLTKNAGVELDEVLAALRAQHYTRGRVEILAVDSGSSDGTLERLARHGVRCISILADEFDHGATRDFAIDQASGAIVVLLVQDALPVGSTWLENLVREFDRPEVVATYCRQIPRPKAPALVAERVQRHLAGVDESRTSRLIEGQSLDALSPEEQMRLCNFDNVSSALRRSIWQRFPFGRCAFAEDLRWARRVIAAGHTITYTPRAQVIHSHDRSIAYEIRRTYLAHHALYELFGLCTVPTLNDVGRSFSSSGASVRTALQHEPTWSRKLSGALRAPIERTLTALAQYRGARDARLGRPARRVRGI